MSAGIGDRTAPRRGHVLVVDDDEDIRDSLCIVLSARGFAVTGAANGREALAKLRDGLAPGVVLLDLMMPVMSGWQFREEQQRDPAIRNVPVVVLTGAGEAARRTAPVDAAAWLSKPVPLDTLVRVLDDQCAPRGEEHRGAP